jgi:glycosyltransferase involved in cell wall biosynthesis
MDMATSETRPKLAVIVANGITGDSRVQKTALAAALAGWDVTLVGRSLGKKKEYTWYGPVRVIRVPVNAQFAGGVSAKKGARTARSRLTQFGIADKKELAQLRAAHRAWVREQSARVGWSDSGVGSLPSAGRKAWIRARREAHRLRLKAYRWEEQRRNPASSTPDAPATETVTGDWRRDWPNLVDLDLAFGPVIEEIEPDVIHANDITMINTGALSAARQRARGRKCAWLYDAHEYVAGVDWPRPVMDSAFPAVEREFIRKADAVVTVSPEIAAVIQQDYNLPELPLVVRNTPIRAAVGKGESSASVRAACELDDDVPLLVYSGWIASERGLGTAIEAMTRLPDYHLAIVSGFRSAELTRLLAEATRLGVRGRVHVVPYVPQHQVADYLSSADLGLICSQRTINYELSLPTKTAEYLHAGLPIIASDVKTLSAYVREHGVGQVFVSGDVDSFVEAVHRGMDTRWTMRSRITDEILDELSWERQMDGLLNLYLRISGRKAPEPLPETRWDVIERPASVDREAPAELVSGWRPLDQTPIRLGLAPANYAGQLAAFAHAVCNADEDVSAEVVQYRAANSKHSFPADVTIEAAALKRLDVQLEQAQRMLPRYTHLIADAFRPVFGGLNGTSIEGDLPALRKAKIKVALLAHGSEVRHPLRHMERNRYSLFHDAPEGYAERLIETAERNIRIAETSGLPVFVTTPDLLVDLPMATWAPLVVDVEAWACDRPVMERSRPVVLHAPSARWTKGTDRILPVLEDFDRRGAIELRLAEGVSWSRIKEMVHEADLVVDQFAVGMYGTFACESMAAGRPVIAHLDQAALEAAEITPPVVNANPDTLAETLEKLLDDREGTAQLGEDSRAYARSQHDGKATALALSMFLK